MINIGNNGTINHIFFWASTMLLRLNDPAQTQTFTIINPIEISYEIICAAERKPPKNAYLELLDQPEKIIPYTEKEETANKYKLE